MAPADDANAPIFSYVMAPGQGFVALDTTLTITVTNNSGSAVTMKGGRNGDLIAITFPVPPAPSPLTDATGFPATSRSTGFLAGVSTSGANIYNIVPNGTQVVAAGQSIIVDFGPITIDAVAGTATLQVQEFIGDNEGDISLPFSKIAQTLNIIAWAVPQNVGLGQSATLYWQSFAGTNVTISGMPTGPRNFPVSGNPPYPGNLAVTLLSSDAQRFYTARVTTNDQRHVETQVGVTQLPPVITLFRTASPPPDPLPPGQSVTFSWTTLYASQLRLQNSAGLPDRGVLPNVSALTVTPGLDAANGLPAGTVPSQIAYTLLANGYKGPVQQSICFTLAPAELVYFKYLNRAEDGTLSNPQFALIPLLWPWSTVFTGPDGVNVLTVPQPGGSTDTYYLGGNDTVHPQIQYFAWEPAEGGGTLRWVTANLVSLTLQPMGTVIPQDQIAQGTLKISGKPETIYTLTGTAQDGTAIASRLTPQG
jgi:hypothetical protein